MIRKDKRCRNRERGRRSDGLPGDRPRYFRHSEEDTQAGPVRVTNTRSGESETLPPYSKSELARIINGPQSLYRDKGHVLRPEDRRRTRRIREEEMERREEQASEEDGQQ